MILLNSSLSSNFIEMKAVYFNRDIIAKGVQSVLTMCETQIVILKQHLQQWGKGQQLLQSSLLSWKINIKIAD